jgi:hypothetical protein
VDRLAISPSQRPATSLTDPHDPVEAGPRGSPGTTVLLGRAICKKAPSLRPLGYEHYDARLWYPIPSPAAALSSTDVRYSVKRVALRPHQIRLIEERPGLSRRSPGEPRRSRLLCTRVPSDLPGEDSRKGCRWADRPGGDGRGLFAPALAFSDHNRDGKPVCAGVQSRGRSDPAAGASELGRFVAVGGAELGGCR